MWGADGGRIARHGERAVARGERDDGCGGETGTQDGARGGQGGLCGGGGGGDYLQRHGGLGRGGEGRGNGKGEGTEMENGKQNQNESGKQVEKEEEGGAGGRAFSHGEGVLTATAFSKQRCHEQSEGGSCCRASRSSAPSAMCTDLSAHRPLGVAHRRLPNAPRAPSLHGRRTPTWRTCPPPRRSIRFTRCPQMRQTAYRRRGAHSTPWLTLAWYVQLL